MTHEAKEVVARDRLVADHRDGRRLGCHDEEVAQLSCRAKAVSSGGRSGEVGAHGELE